MDSRYQKHQTMIFILMVTHQEEVHLTQLVINPQWMFWALIHTTDVPNLLTMAAQLNSHQTQRVKCAQINNVPLCKLTLLQPNKSISKKQLIQNVYWIKLAMRSVKCPFRSRIRNSSIRISQLNKKTRLRSSSEKLRSNRASCRVRSPTSRKNSMGIRKSLSVPALQWSQKKPMWN